MPELPNPFSDVLEFNVAAGQPPRHGQPNWHLLRQAIAHCAEECRELQDASANLERRVNEAETLAEVCELFAEVLDGACDLVYVATNVLLHSGFDYDELWNEVHRANMAKLPKCPHCDEGFLAHKDESCEVCSGTGHLEPIHRFDGKILKPDGWTPPNLARLLKAQLWKGLAK